MTFGVTDVIFIIFSALAVLSALFVIFARDLFRAAIAFIMSLLSLAGLFFLFNAEFIGAIQILVNVGAVSILLVVTIMLVRDLSSGSSRVNIWLSAFGVGVAALTFVAILLGVTGADWFGLLSDNAAAERALLGDGANAGVLDDAVALTGRFLLREFLLVLEILGVLIAAALIGAVAVLRQSVQDGDDEPRQPEAASR